MARRGRQRQRGAGRDGHSEQREKERERETEEGRGGQGTHTYEAAPQIKMREDKASSKENEDVIDRSLSALFTSPSVPPAISGSAKLHTSKS